MDLMPEFNSAVEKIAAILSCAPRDVVDACERAIKSKPTDMPQESPSKINSKARVTEVTQCEESNGGPACLVTQPNSNNALFYKLHLTRTIISNGNIMSCNEDYRVYMRVLRNQDNSPNHICDARRGRGFLKSLF